MYYGECHERNMRDTKVSQFVTFRGSKPVAKSLNFDASRAAAACFKFVKFCLLEF